MTGNYMQIRENYSLEAPYTFQNREIANTIHTSTKYDPKDSNQFCHSNNLSTINAVNVNSYPYKSQTIQVNNELDRYKTYQSYQSTNHTSSKEDDISTVNTLKAKLETKKLRLREMKKQFENVLEENANLKFKLAEMEKYKSSLNERIQSYEQENNFKSYDFKVDRERDFINTINQLEHDVRKFSKKINFKNILPKLLEKIT
jgi:uncharacterized protein involved in exopolysaccharide biosynthesis